MNAPDRYEKFVVPEGVLKIDFEKDTKIANSGTFILQREDHTIGNLFRTQLHRDPTVTFAGYRIPHPLEYQLLVKVRTDDTNSPLEAGRVALAELSSEFVDLREQLQKEIQRMRPITYYSHHNY